MISRRLYEKNNSFSLTPDNYGTTINNSLSLLRTAYYKENYNLVSRSEQISCSHRRNKPEIFPPQPKPRGPFKKKKEKNKFTPLYNEDDEDIPSDYEEVMMKDWSEEDKKRFNGVRIEDWTPEHKKEFEEAEKEFLSNKNSEAFESFEVTNDDWKKDYGEFSKAFGKVPDDED